MKKMEALSLEDLEMVSGGNCIDTGSLGEANKVKPPEKDKFEWLKPPHKK